MLYNLTNYTVKTQVLQALEYESIAEPSAINNQSMLNKEQLESLQNWSGLCHLTLPPGKYNYATYSG